MTADTLALPREENVLMSSRRTIMSGEVVTFATKFEPKDGVFGLGYDAYGRFEISASRDAVIVHRAEFSNSSEAKTLIAAIEFAERARALLAPHWRGGEESKFPKTPTICDASNFPPAK